MIRYDAITILKSVIQCEMITLNLQRYDMIGFDLLASDQYVTNFDQNLG